mgnify:CR=1 FL=1
MEIQGKVYKVMEPVCGVSKSGNEWKKQEFLIETEGQYPKKICFEVFGEDKINEMNLHEGEMVRIYFEIEAKEWNGRWFNKVAAWKVDKSGTQQKPARQPQPVQQPEIFPPSPSDEKDDLPF